MTVSAWSGDEYTMTGRPGSDVPTSWTTTDPAHAGCPSGPCKGQNDRATASTATMTPPSASRGCPQNGFQSGIHHGSWIGLGLGWFRSKCARIPGQNADQSG